jgi:hypothetical protein
MVNQRFVLLRFVKILKYVTEISNFLKSQQKQHTVSPLIHPLSLQILFLTLFQLGRDNFYHRYSILRDTA